MEHKVVCEEARAADEDDQMVTCELEAAEVLAGLPPCSAGCGDSSGSAELECPSQQLLKEPTVTSSRRLSQDQVIAVQKFCGNTCTMVTGALKLEETVRSVPSQLCSRGYQSSSTGKLKQNLMEAEKEVRGIHRVLANRESTRQTICRRQAMHLELTREAADLTEENEYVKKEKELAVKEHNSLKCRNEFLEVQMANIKQAEPREMQEEPKSPQAEIALTHQCGISSSSGTPLLEDNLQLSMGARPVESFRPTRNSEADDAYDLNAVSAPEQISQGLLKKNQEPIICCHKKLEDASAANKAMRRRRMELMKLKNIH